MTRLTEEEPYMTERMMRIINIQGGPNRSRRQSQTLRYQICSYEAYQQTGWRLRQRIDQEVPTRLTKSMIRIDPSLRAFEVTV